MDYQPRTIAFLSEVFHPPLPPDPRPVQRLHNQMFEAGEPAYSSFAVTPNGPVLSNPVAHPGASSQVAFLADRVQFREELGSLTNEGFADRIYEVLSSAAPLRGVQVVTGQQVTLRSLINPRAYRDARAFLREGMFGFADQTTALKRDPQLYGLRMVFPPQKEETNAYSLRIESYNNDVRSLFIEVQGTFGPALVTRGLDPLRENVLATYAFLTDSALPFVARFDARQQA